MSDLDGLISQLKLAWAAADRRSPGAFKFVTSITAGTGDCICVVAVALDSADARASAAKALTG